MKAKHQRLMLALAAVVAVSGGGLLAASGLKNDAAYFRTPADLAASRVAPGTALRLGGMVEAGSLRRLGDGVSIAFVATDGTARTPVTFKGIVPDLFREGSGMVADGRMGADGVFVADKILAKHDERYMPPQMAGTDAARAVAAGGTLVDAPSAPIPAPASPTARR